MAVCGLINILTNEAFELLVTSSFNRTIAEKEIWNVREIILSWWDYNSSSNKETGTRERERIILVCKNITYEKRFCLIGFQ